MEEEERFVRGYLGREERRGDTERDEERGRLRRLRHRV